MIALMIVLYQSIIIFTGNRGRPVMYLIMVFLFTLNLLKI